MKPIRIAIFGVGNCAKSLVEGVALYSSRKENASEGLAFYSIGGYTANDIEFVLAYDIDARKVDQPLEDAIYAKPNCAMNLVDPDSYHFAKKLEEVTQDCYDVRMGSVLDGCAVHMWNSEDGFDVVHDRERPKDVLVQEIKDSGANVALIYLPVGSQKATEFYVECLLEAGVPFVNCIPVFIVSNPEWAKRIHEAGIPAIGDDMRSQVGASILSQVLHEMFLDRGAKVNFHCQTNQGGNTDFFNMTVPARLTSKKKSKENVITSQDELRNSKTGYIHAGPSDYIKYLGDNKVATLRIEAEGFGGAPVTLDCRLSVQDSPNSAGVVIDAVRYLKTAVDLGITGPLEGPSAFTQKTPPKQMKYVDAYEACRAMACHNTANSTGNPSTEPQGASGGRLEA